MTANRPAWKPQKNNPHCMRAQKQIEDFSQNLFFIAEDMKKIYLSTRLRLYPTQMCSQDLLSRSRAEWRWFCRSPVATPLSLELSGE